jgi:hypothetical protein
MGWVVNATPRPLYLRERDSILHFTGGWMDPEPVWTFAENLAPIGIRSPDRPAQKLYIFYSNKPHRVLTQEAMWLVRIRPKSDPTTISNTEDG